jgi:hypothetical protein
MGLFSFFRSKTETQGTYDDSFKALKDGVLFEDNNYLLKWGAAIEQEKSYFKRELRADRNIYNWGERVILSGLILNLTTVVWKNGGDDFEYYPPLEFLAEGEDAEKYLQIISSHLEKHIGPPVRKENGAMLEWGVDDVRLSLFLFEQHHVNKLNFQIKKMN